MINELTYYQQAIICTVFGMLALGAAYCIFIPQLVYTTRTKNTSGSSLITYILNAFSWFFWFVWATGFYINNMQKNPVEPILPQLYMSQFMPSVISNALSSALSIVLLVIKIRHVLLARKLKITEMQLAKILLDKQAKKYFNNSKKIKMAQDLTSIFIIFGTLIVGAIIALLLSFCTWPKPTGADDWAWVGIVNFICAGFSEALSWPQFIKCLRKEDTTGISIWWATFFVVSGIVFLIYNLLMGFGTGKWSWNIFATTVFAGYIPNISILVIKIRNIVKAKKHNMTEKQYTEQVLIPLVKQKELAKRKKKI